VRSYRKYGIAVVLVLLSLGVGIQAGRTIGPSQLQATNAASHHPVVRPATKASGSSTTTRPVPPSTTISPPAPTTTEGPTKATTIEPTTTSSPSPALCEWSQFKTYVVANINGGQVDITLTAKNLGPPCTDNGQFYCACWAAYAENASSQIVWEVPNPPVSGTHETVPLPIVPAGWTTTTAVTWDEDECALPNCSNTPVATGSYDIFGKWGQTVSPPVPVSINSPSPTTTTTVLIPTTSTTG